MSGLHGLALVTVWAYGQFGHELLAGRAIGRGGAVGTQPEAAAALAILELKVEEGIGRVHGFS
jgi:hypothetical protein